MLKHGLQRRAIAVLLPCLVVVVVSAFVLQRHLACQAQVRHVDELVQQAEAALAEGQLASAGELAQTAQEILKAEPGLAPPEQEQTWTATFNRVADLRNRQERLRETLASAEKTAIAGDIEQAVARARGVAGDLEREPRLKDGALGGQVERLSQIGKLLAEARGIRGKARGRYDAALKELEALGSRLPPGDGLARPARELAAEFGKLVRDDGKLDRPMDPGQLQALARDVQRMVAVEKGFTLGELTAAEGQPLTYQGKRLLLRIAAQPEGPRLILETEGHRFKINEKYLAPAQEDDPPTAIFLRHRPGFLVGLVLTLAQAMQAAHVPLGPVWEVKEEAPYAAASATEGSRVLFFCTGRLYGGMPVAPPLSREAAHDALGRATEELARAVETDAPTPEDVRKVVVPLVRGAYKELPAQDQLPGAFCRAALNDGYLEANLPGAAERLKTPLAGYRAAYAKYVELTPRYEGYSADGGEAAWLADQERRLVYRLYDPKSDTTTFSVQADVEDHPLMFGVYAFAGRRGAFPEGPPRTAWLAHPVAGLLAAYDPAAGKLTYDQQTWDKGVRLASFIPSAKEHFFGEPGWAFPPHVWLADGTGRTIGLVTPFGRVDTVHFVKMADTAARRKAEDAFLDRLAAALPNSGYLHLYYLYFHKYVYDSPVDTARGLIGNKTDSGATHQDVYQSLEREWGGKSLGKCDDLAEVFQNVTRRQGKLSFVLGLPGHAACGWVEKTDKGIYRMQFADTGPARIGEGPDLEKLVEATERSYDDKGTMDFDPKAIEFLFRFAGEPTRTPYVLSCRMLVDPEYAEVLERVQSYWHFHFYALGIETMEARIKGSTQAKPDRVPENCTELAGLYEQVREVKKAVSWTEEAMKLLGKDDVVSRLAGDQRIGIVYRENRDKAAALAAIRGAVAELGRLPHMADEKDGQRYISSRLQFADLLTSIDKPWLALELVAEDAAAVANFNVGQDRAVPLEVLATLTNAYWKMKDLIRTEGHKPTVSEEKGMKGLEKMLDVCYSRALFDDDDDYSQVLAKYAFLGRFYGAREGRGKLLAQLLSTAPYTQKERKHRERTDADHVAEDWQWIRLAPASYSILIADALDMEAPPEKWRKDEAAKLCEAMGRAVAAARKFGVVATGEHDLLAVQITHAMLTKDWAEFEAVLKEVRRRDWARLTLGVSEALGHGARFVTPDEFENLFRTFTQYVNERAPYFHVVYEAYRVDGFEQARRAARLSVERWPGEENMKREARYLDQIIQNRQAEQKEAKPAPGAPEKQTQAPLGIRGRTAKVAAARFLAQRPRAGLSPDSEQPCAVSPTMSACAVSER